MGWKGDVWKQDYGADEIQLGGAAGIAGGGWVGMGMVDGGENGVCGRMERNGNWRTPRAEGGAGTLRAVHCAPGRGQGDVYLLYYAQMCERETEPKRLTLVVPVYNAPDLARALVARLPELEEAARGCGFELVETILVDDGSDVRLDAAVPGDGADARLDAVVPGDGSDGRLDAAVPGDGKRLVVLRTEPNRGKGAAVRRGALAAKGDWVLMSDVDLSAPFAEFARLAPYADAWIVCGSRFGRPGMPLVRRFLSRVFHVVVRMTCGMDVQDTQCGFKLFRMDVMRAVFAAQRIERFAFDVELIRRARDAGGTVKEVPVAWCGGKRSSLRVFRDAPRMLWDLLRIGPCRASSRDRTRAGR